MKKTVLLFASLALAAPAVAQSPNVRPNLVYTWASDACPKAAEIRAQVGDSKSIQFLSEIAKEAKMTHDEETTFVLMCFMYDRGSRGAHPPA